MNHLDLTGSVHYTKYFDFILNLTPKAFNYITVNSEIFQFIVKFRYNAHSDWLKGRTIKDYKIWK